MYEVIKSEIYDYHRINCSWKRTSVWMEIFSTIRKECSAGNITWDERMELFDMLGVE
jgi:hypothetical protein